MISKIPEIRLRQSCIYLKINPVKFHPDPIWNDGALRFFEERRRRPYKNKNKKMSSDMGLGSVPDKKYCQKQSLNATVVIIVY